MYQRFISPTELTEWSPSRASPRRFREYTTREQAEKIEQLQRWIAQLLGERLAYYSQQHSQAVRNYPDS